MLTLARAVADLWHTLTTYDGVADYQREAEQRREQEREFVNDVNTYLATHYGE